MATIKTQTVKTEIVANGEVTKILLKAVQAANTMLASCKAAARSAVDAHGEKLKTVPFDQAVKTIRECYRTELGEKSDHNVLANFTDAVTVLLAADMPVTIEKREKGETIDVHMTAADAINESKHNMKQAAKIVREAKGGARQSVGRKPSAPSPSKPVAVALTATQAAESSARHISAILTKATPAQMKIIKAELAKVGYTLTKKAK